jgi:hypothetical protein
MLSHKKSVWIASGVFILTLISSSAIVKAKVLLTDPIELKRSKEWKVIDGFRSAKFGMDEKQLLRAISKDLKVPKTKIKRRTNFMEKITVMEVTVPELLAFGGPATILYTLGYKSKKLANVSIIWGKGAAEKFDAQGVVDAANFLRDHFLKNQFDREKLLINSRMNDTEILVFRGFDKQKRGVLLVLTTPKGDDDRGAEKLQQEYRLKLQYTLNPIDPDIYRPTIVSGHD